MRDYSGPKSLKGLFKTLVNIFDSKQDNIPGIKGQLIGFDESGKPVAQEPPDTGVVTFKGRQGDVEPLAGDYTPQMVGADPAGSAANVKKELTEVIGQQVNTLTQKIKDELDPHIADKSNPHGVTKAQVGLGNVPNVATNDQTPTYTQAGTLATLSSGEKLSVSMGKIMKAITDLISHIANKGNPHAVTTAQINAVPNTRKINGKALSADITLGPADVKALPSAGGTLTGPLTIGKMRISWNESEQSLDFEIV